MAVPIEPYHLHFISHTHWDREWYLSHEHFRARLVDLVDHLIDLLETSRTSAISTSMARQSFSTIIWKSARINASVWRS